MDNVGLGGDDGEKSGQFPRASSRLGAVGRCGNRFLRKNTDFVEKSSSSNLAPSLERSPLSRRASTTTAYVSSECSQRLADLHTGHHRRPSNGCSPPILPLRAPHPHSPQTLWPAPRSWYEKGPHRGRERDHRQIEQIKLGAETGGAEEMGVVRFRPL